MYYGCKIPTWNCQKIIQDMKIEDGAEKKKCMEKTEATENARKKLRCENRFAFYSSIL